MAYESSPRKARPAKKGKRVPFNTYLDEELFDQLVEAAQRNERSVAAEIRLAIRRHLERAA